MYNIAIVGDVHINPSVSSRKDDYFHTCLTKIEEISRNCKNIIFLGDLFNTPSMPNNYLVETYCFLKNLKNNNNNNFYTIIGNHDIYNYREDSLNKTSLGVLHATGVVKVIFPDEPCVIEDTTFHTTFVDFNKAKNHLKLKTFNNNDILLVHHYFEDMYEGFKYDDLKHIGCSRLFFGHEHKPFERTYKQFQEFTAYRCGALLRNSADPINLTRPIFYFGLAKNEVKLNILDCAKPACEVFTDSALSRENNNKKKFISSINEVIDKYTNNINTQVKFSIKKVLEEINASNQTMEYIKQKYINIGKDFV